jgi:hypothetical protein
MIGIRVSLTVAQKEVFHFQHTNYTHHPNVSCALVGGVLVHFEPHFDGNSFKAIVSGGPRNRKWGPVITHLLLCTESMLKGRKWARSVWFVDRERSGRDEETRATQCRVVRERRRTSAILRNRNIAKIQKNKKSKKTNKHTKTSAGDNCEDGFRSCVSRVSSTYY